VHWWSWTFSKIIEWEFTVGIGRESMVAWHGIAGGMARGIEEQGVVSSGDSRYRRW